MPLSNDHLKRLASVDQGMISDCMTRIGVFGWMDGIRAVNTTDVSFAGPARTILFGPKRGTDNFTKTTYAVIESLSPGDVLVFAAGGTSENLLGDNVAAFAQRHSMAAIVADSFVRDATGLNRLTIPVCSRGITARIPVGMEPVALDVPVACAGAQVRPGDILVGGLDGVLVLPPTKIDDILVELEDIEKVEEELQRLIANGGSASDIAPVLKRKKQSKTAVKA